MWIMVPGVWEGGEVRRGMQRRDSRNGAVSPTATLWSHSDIISTSVEPMEALLDQIWGVGKALLINTSILPEKYSVAEVMAEAIEGREDRSVWQVLKF